MSSEALEQPQGLSKNPTDIAIDKWDNNHPDAEKQTSLGRNETYLFFAAGTNMPPEGSNPSTMWSDRQRTRHTVYLQLSPIHLSKGEDG